MKEFQHQGYENSVTITLSVSTNDENESVIKAMVSFGN